ncbi:GNAT family N-acetyltransferase [Ideonella sp. A 288]|uniref:GNAT family N-acetyltransferase n=1 Tax=Ideonella sp. A 288 TaxID=1962181 RepID=UPI001303E225|nr:GNAT family N-acetyltransferase [Ideonella sp. A 288]
MITTRHGRSAPAPAWRLRLAEPRDEALLLRWRNDPAARQASHQQDLVDAAVHMQWFARALRDPERQIFIAELDGQPVAMARLEREPGGHQLSWFVDEAARGRGVGRRLLAEVLAATPGAIRAEIKSDNAASRRLAASVGLIAAGECHGICLVVRP